MKKFNKFLLISLSAILIACGGEDKSQDDNIDVEKNPLGAAMKMAQNMQEQAEKMQKNMEERKDAKAMHYEELIKFLPTEIDGYTAEEPDGGTVEMQGTSYSNADITFKNEAGERIKVSLLDYNAALSMYSMATAMWTSGLKIDTKDELAQSYTVNDEISGWETFKKKTGKASVILGINNRFMLTIEADKQENCDNVKSIAKNMDLDKLASL
ncbi:MAG: hypothetical protein RQ875_09790 [Vicingaceae bacterium]|nr:hypothetical protein [Vicingaceae bacterium]